MGASRTLNKTVTGPKRVSKVYIDVGIPEYQVEFYIEGKLQELVTYYTNDYIDALSTARMFCKGAYEQCD